MNDLKQPPSYHLPEYGIQPSAYGAIKVKDRYSRISDAADAMDGIGATGKLWRYYFVVIGTQELVRAFGQIFKNPITLFLNGKLLDYRHNSRRPLSLESMSKSE